MLFDPYYGTPNPVPDVASVWRSIFGYPWLFDPWDGSRRNVLDIDSDVNGYLILPPGETLYANK